MTATTNPTPGRNDFAELGNLILRAGDGQLSEAEHAALEMRLLKDPLAREWYCRYVMLEVDLAWNEGCIPKLPEAEGTKIARAASSTGEENAGLKSVPWLRRRRMLVAGVAMAASLAVVAWGLWRWPAQDHPHAKATVIASTGEITLVRHEHSAKLKRGEQVLADSRIDAASHESELTLQFADGSEAHFTGPGSLTLHSPLDRADRSGKRLELHQGVLHVRATTQSENSPLVVIAPQVEVVVRGTRFVVSAIDPKLSKVELLSGEVDVIHRHDGRRVSLAAGNSIVASDENPSFVALPLPTRLQSKLTLGPNAGEQLLGIWERAVISLREAVVLSHDVSGNRSEGHRVPRSADEDLLLGNDRNSLFVVARSGKLRQFTTANWKLESSWNISPFEQASLSPRSDRLVTVRKVVDERMETGAELRFWRIPDKKLECTRLLKGLQGPFRMAWHNEFLVLHAESHAQGVWLVSPNETVMPTFLATDGVVPLALAVATDSEQFVFSTLAGSIEVWSLADRTRRFSLPAHGVASKLIISDDEEYLAAALSDGRVRVWRISDSKEVAFFADLEALPEALAFAPDSRFLALHSRNRGTRAFDMTTALGMPREDAPSPSDTIPRGPGVNRP